MTESQFQELLVEILELGLDVANLSGGIGDDWSIKILDNNINFGFLIRIEESEFVLDITQK